MTTMPKGPCATPVRTARKRFWAGSGNRIQPRFLYLARAEGGKRWGFIPADSSPFPETEGDVVIP